MAKYDDLVKLYQDEIAQIKELEQRHAAAIAHANSFDPIVHPEPDHDAIAEMVGAHEEARQIYDDLLFLYEALTQDIEAEYHNVPFTQPRQQGIEGFWREAGLDRR